MAKAKLCAKLRKLLPALLRKAFQKDLNAVLASRGQELWFIGIDSDDKKLTDICGTIDPATLAAINAKGFFESDAGFKADAQNVLPLSGRKADIFMLNKDHFLMREAFLDPLVVHELAHFLEQIGDVPVPEGNDEANATAILESLHPDILRLHTREWALPWPRCRRRSTRQ
jgi:hypothetical protein